MSSLYRKGKSYSTDVDNAEYIIWSGAFPGGNGSNFQAIGKHVAQALQAGNLKIDVFDPTLGNGLVTPHHARHQLDSHQARH